MANARPSLRFFHPAPLRTRTNKILAAIEADGEPTAHAEALAAVVLSLTEAGFDYYFVKATRDAKLGFMARQTAGLGLAGATRVMSPIIRSVIGGATPAQLRAISRHIRQLMA